MEIKQASVLVSAVLVCLAPAPALTQTMTLEEAVIIACKITPNEMFVEECNRTSSSGSDDSNSRKKRGVNDVPSLFRPYHLNCPSATDQSAIYEINEVPVEFDFDLFTSEVMASPILFECLEREFLEFEPPVAFVEEFVNESNETCPSRVRPLFDYKSVRFPGLCAVLSVGDFIRLQECVGSAAGKYESVRVTGKCAVLEMGDVIRDVRQFRRARARDLVCQGCKQPSIHLNRQKRCITQYRAANFWAFCPDQPDGQRFVRDKIIIPVACNCLEIPCERVFLTP